MTTATRTERALTETELEAILPHAERGDLVKTLIGIYDALLRDRGATWETSQVVDPKDFAIPTSQTKDLLEVLSLAQETTLTATNVYLDWVNIGPSSFDPEPN